jgi:signal transduction histidine kinase
MTLQRRLALLVISLLIPALLACGFAAYVTYTGERARAEQNLLHTSRALAIVVDRELDSIEHTLRALATSPSLTTADLAAFRRQAIEAVPQEGLWVLLTAPSGRQVLNTLRPPGAPLPMHALPENVRSIVETRRAIVTDLFIGAVSGSRVLAVEVPVVREGTVVYVLSMGVLPGALNRILSDQKLPVTWVASIFDRNGITVARTRELDRFIGKPAAPRLAEAMRNADEGLIEVVSLEGTPVVASYSRSPVHGWRFAIGVPRVEVEASIRRSMWAVLGVGLALVAMGLGLSVVFARSISRPIAALAISTEALGRGDPVVASRSGLREVDDVGLALHRASGMLIERSAERDRAEAALERSKEALEALVADRTSELTRANEELARSNAELEQFAYAASHDLQEPLRMVTSYLGLVERRYADRLDERARTFIGYAVDGAARMRTLITDLLAYSRIGRREEPRTLTDIGACLGDALGNLTVAIAESGATVTHDPLPLLSVNAPQIATLFQNLLGNAVKFRGEESPRIHVSAERQPTAWVFGVRDNGIGIAPEHHDRIFTVFQRLHTRAEYPGTGIGLAICRKVVERHGGRMWVESEPGKGSTFFFTLPVAGAA